MSFGDDIETYDPTERKRDLALIRAALEEAAEEIGTSAPGLAMRIRALSPEQILSKVKGSNQ